MNTKQKFPLPLVLKRFLQTESASGVVMIACAAMALLFANSTFSSHYSAFSAPLQFWVKDVLMVLFFLVVGMELKRELSEGFLSKPGQVLLPFGAALGGMIMPAALFMLFNHDTPANMAGWAVASATDIAFALCILTLAGKHVPPAVKIFLLAIAIFDDLGAILIIAAFYSQGLDPLPLLLAAGGIGALVLLNRRGIAAITPYMLIGVYLWFCLHEGGIHTTIAGVIVGMSIPMRARANPRQSPLNHAIHRLHPWVSFLILPVFAFTAAGVNLTGLRATDLLEPLPLGIAMGLFLGKQLGIFGTTWLLVKTRLAQKPEGAGWLHIYGVSIIAGIGFTMSLFIALLAFEDPAFQELAKIGIIAGSVLSALWGWLIFSLQKRLTLV